MLIKIRLHYAATIESLTESWHQPPKSRDNIINKQIIDNIQWIFNTQNKDMSKISTPGERPSYISYIAPNIPDRTEQKCKSNAIPPIPHARKPQTYNQGSRLQGTEQQHSIEGYTKTTRGTIQTKHAKYRNN